MKGLRHKVLRLFRVRNLLLVSLGSFLLFLALNIGFPLPTEKAYSRIVLDRDGALLNAYLSPDEKWRMRSPLEEVPEELVKALLAKEDRWFYYHPGVNPVAIVRAAWSNVTSGKRVSGASTITMQVARMLEPKARSWGGKLWEAFRALQLEWHYSKREILEMYLSNLPFGGNIEGVKAASFLYLNRPPDRLSLSQCILLTVIPNRPNSLRPDLHPQAAIAARNAWIDRFAEMETFSKPDLAVASGEAIPQKRFGIHARAPQFCELVRQRYAGERLPTTLDLGLQMATQRLLRNHVARVRAQGIHNGAVLVLDNASQEVRAYCASADFADKAAQGEVNAITALRSPGSTLKPLLYASAFDQGLLSPKRVVKDLPTKFAGYTPVNYNRQFQGQVTVEDALRHSLNLPAVRCLQRLGLHDFVAQLVASGFQGVARQAKDLGLSVALGGCGATLEELVRLYSAYAHGGLQMPLRYLKGRPGNGPRVRICSPEAAFLLADILSGLERPDLPGDLVDRTKLPKIAWKTGTSFGRRDAWAIGFNPRYTIGVWMGNMDGSSVPVMSGGRTAVPLLVDLFNAIDFDQEKAWFPQPKGLVRRKVCSATGLLPADFCTHTSWDYHIHNVSSQKVCDRYREIFTDSAATVQYCTACLPVSGYQRLRIPLLDAELMHWYTQQKVVIIRPPAHNPACEGVFYTAGPRIISPEKGDEYFVQAGQELLLQAAVEPDATTHYWFVNEQYLGATAAGARLFFAPKTGRQEIACMDDKGRIESIFITVNQI